MNTSFERSANTTDEWYTPIEIVNALGSFDLDPCSPTHRLWDTAKRHITPEEDGLADVVIRCLDLAGANGIEMPYGAPLSITNQGKTFTEKIWFIVQSLVDERASLTAKLHTTIVHCWQLAKEYNFDLVWHIKKKMAYNSLRSPKHGKRY